MSATIVEAVPAGPTGHLPPGFWAEHLDLARNNPGRTVRLAGFRDVTHASRAAYRITHGVVAAARPAGTYHATARTEGDGGVVYITWTQATAPVIEARTPQPRPEPLRRAEVALYAEPRKIGVRVDELLGREWDRSAA